MSESLTTATLCRAGESLLLVIDCQERLAKAMPEGDLQDALRATDLLLQSAGLLDIPRFYSEQYPRGLGATLPALREHLDDAARVCEKTAFSCCGSDGFTERLEQTQRNQVVLAGMESHVCVLQTAVQLLQRGYRVFVAEDACCARSRARSANAMARLRHAGVQVAHSESIVFEWLRDAAHPQFKAVSRLLK